MDTKVKKILKYVLSFALAGGLIAYSCSKVDWSSFAKAMESCNWAYILLALLAGFVAMYFRALRWRLTIKPIAPSIKRMTAFHGVNIGNLSNMAVPYSGELVRCGVITSGTGAPYDQVHEIRGTLRFLAQLEMRPSSNAPSPVESREAPPTSSFPGFSEPP